MKFIQGIVGSKRLVASAKKKKKVNSNPKGCSFSMLRHIYVKSQFVEDIKKVIYLLNIP